MTRHRTIASTLVIALGALLGCGGSPSHVSRAGARPPERCADGPDQWGRGGTGPWGHTDPESSGWLRLAPAAETAPDVADAPGDCFRSVVAHRTDDVLSITARVALDETFERGTPLRVGLTIVGFGGVGEYSVGLEPNGAETIVRVVVAGGGECTSSPDGEGVVRIAVADTDDHGLVEGTFEFRCQFRDVRSRAPGRRFRGAFSVDAPPM